MKQNRIALAGMMAVTGTLALALAACQPQAPADTSTEKTTAAPEAVAEATPAPPPAAAEANASDQRAFAGTFSGTLPCASCPGIDTRIELAGDGTYKLTETYQGEKGAPVNGDGTWTAEADGKHIRLDPNSKSEDDRLFELLSQDQIRLLDREGKHIESTLPYTLQRVPAAG